MSCNVLAQEWAILHSVSLRIRKSHSFPFAGAASASLSALRQGQWARLLYPLIALFEREYGTANQGVLGDDIHFICPGTG